MVKIDNKISDFVPVNEALVHAWYISNTGRVLFYLGRGEFLSFSNSCGTYVVDAGSFTSDFLIRPIDINVADISIVVK